MAANPLAVQSGARAEPPQTLWLPYSLFWVWSSLKAQAFGGGAFLVCYDGTTREITTLDGRETAPMAATPTLFQDSFGAPLKFFDAMVGGLSVSTPRTPALMATVQQRWGKLAWSALFSEAVSLADNGFTVSPRLAAMVSYDQKCLNQFPSTAAYLLPDGKPVKVGDILHNPAYAASLLTLGRQGPKPSIPA